MIGLLIKTLISLRFKINAPSLTIILLNWNRKYLLEKTIRSIFVNTLSSFELVIIDNGSNDGSQELIIAFEQKYQNVKKLLLDKNIGGEAINLGFEKCKSEFILISENDLEYQAGWDVKMLVPFFIFSRLGQLSPFSPFPQADRGEIWEVKPAAKARHFGTEIYLAQANVGTTSMIRKEIIQKGIRWSNIENKTDSPFQFPDDAKFSADIKSLGYDVAWSKTYLAKNVGHNVNEWMKNIDYYMNNYRSKSWLGIEGMKQRLRENGYDLRDNKIIKA